MSTIARRPTSRLLSLPEVNRWVLAPQLGLERLLRAGQIEIEEVRMMNNLVELMHELQKLRPIALSSPTCLQRLIRKIATGESVEDTLIDDAFCWVGEAARQLKGTSRTDYRVALGRMLEMSELRYLLAEATKAKQMPHAAAA